MKIKWVKKVYSDGRHSAFTGLTFDCNRKPNDVFVAGIEL